MLKLMIFLRGPKEPDGGPGLRAWILDHAVAFSRCARPTGLTVNLNDQPAEVRVHASSAEATAAVPYEAVVQLWFDAADDPSLAAEKFWTLKTDGSLSMHDGGMSGYRVLENVVWNREKHRRGRAPGVAYIGLLDFHTDLPDTAARRSWTLHAEAARLVHVGATRYRQNWIAAPLTSDADAARGISELYFPSRDALIHGFFDSDRGRAEIRRDTAHFISRATRLYTTEHVLI